MYRLEQQILRERVEYLRRALEACTRRQCFREWLLLLPWGGDWR